MGLRLLDRWRAEEVHRTRAQVTKNRRAGATAQRGVARRRKQTQRRCASPTDFQPFQNFVSREGGYNAHGCPGRPGARRPVRRSSASDGAVNRQIGHDRPDRLDPAAKYAPQPMCRAHTVPRHGDGSCASDNVEEGHVEEIPSRRISHLRCM